MTFTAEDVQWAADRIDELEVKPDYVEFNAVTGKVSFVWGVADP